MSNSSLQIKKINISSTILPDSSSNNIDPKEKIHEECIVDEEAGIKKIMVDFSTPSEIKEREREHKEKSKRIQAPAKIKRVVAQPEQWAFSGVDLSNSEIQFMVAACLREDSSSLLGVTNEQKSLAIHQIKTKLCGYKAQDIHKKILDEEKFIQFHQVIDLFTKSGLRCFYCKDLVQVVYEYVREPRQWTLERMDNKRGHNADNVEIACLNCNLRRRTMRSELYVMTKQMRVVNKV